VIFADMMHFVTASEALAALLRGKTTGLLHWLPVHERTKRQKETQTLHISHC